MNFMLNSFPKLVIPPGTTLKISNSFNLKKFVKTQWFCAMLTLNHYSLPRKSPNFFSQFQAKNLDFTDLADWYIMLLLVISEICNSPLTLIALCLTVMTLSKVIISCTNAYLTSCKSHAPPNTALSSGLTEGLVMFLLSLQTGLIDMGLPQRLGAMSIILFIVAASLFQTVLEITHPVLLSLSASSRNVWSHLKVRFFLFV